MSNTVFVLGAGTSKGGGAPLMAKFLDVADNLQPVHSKPQLDLNNIVSVLAALEISSPEV